MALSQEQINALYRDVFKRDAEPEAVAFWQSQADVAHPDTLYQRLVATPEGRSRMIEDTYKATLGRQADAGGLQHWLQSGLDRAGIEAGLRASDEYAPVRRAQEINATLYQDPAYAAYMRQMQADQAALENRRIADTERIRNMEGIQYNQINQQERSSLRDIADRYGGRGTFRSSARQLDQGDAATQFGAQRNQFALSNAQKISDMQAQYSNEFNNLSSKRDEAEVEARKRLFARDAEAAGL